MLRWKRLLLYGTVGVIVGLAVTIYLPWYAVGPGPARAVQPLIRFEDRTRYESEGRFVMTSVSYTQADGFRHAPRLARPGSRRGGPFGPVSGG